jgi:hypothetical protein
LDLRGESNLKTLFDAGLRPRKERGLGSQCEVFNQRITFLVAPNFRFPLIADNVRFTLLEDGRIAEAVAKGANLRWEAARATAAGLFGIAGSVPPDLDKALGVLKNASFELMRDIGVRVPGEPETHVTFMPGDFVPTDPTNQYVRVALRFYWKERMQHGKLRQAPLTPPAGYEAESMEPLPFDVSSKEPQ